MTARTRKTRSIVSLFFVICSLFFATACRSLVEKSGRALDGSAFAEKTVAVYRGSLASCASCGSPGSPAASARAARKDPAGIEIREVRSRDGEHSVIITLNNYPSIRFRGSLPDEQGQFGFVSLDYLGGSSQGWNEYRMDIYGEGNLVMGETTALFSVQGPVETGQISRGRIRRYDTRIIGDEAVSSLRNRHERVIALAGWMHARENPPEGPALPALTFEGFERYWKPVLFPELFPGKKRPRNWQRDGDLWVTAEDTDWNTGYTERVFPEELRPIRNSGTLLRDWEEALEWIYNQYEWEHIIERLSQETVLIKVESEREKVVKYRE